MTKTTHTLGPTQQLVDLNEDLTNFDLTFSAKTPNGAPFYAVVVDQATVNVGAPFQYKHCPQGSIEANIVADKGVYQNFFLALKADKQCECDVTIHKRAKPARPKPAPVPAAVHQHQSHNSVKPDAVDWKMVLMVIAIIGAGAGVYYYMNKKKGSTIDIPVTAPVAAPTPALLSPPTMDFAPEISGPSLLDRLNNLPIS